MTGQEMLEIADAHCPKLSAAVRELMAAYKSEIAERRRLMKVLEGISQEIEEALERYKAGC